MSDLLLGGVPGLFVETVGFSETFAALAENVTSEQYRIRLVIFKTSFWTEKFRRVLLSIPAPFCNNSGMDVVATFGIIDGLRRSVWKC